MAETRLAETDLDIARCFPVLLHLRPLLVEKEFVARVRVQEAQGYRLAMFEHAGAVVSVAGFRVMEMLHSGRTLYVDDLVTDPTQRSQGFGKAMLQWLRETAIAEGCDTFSLDSGTQRQDAHAFYFREGMRVTSFHFVEKLR